MSERQPGTILDDKYEIVRPLGSGGMGDVFLVRHLHLQQERVVKILRQELASNEAAQKRFLREARLATHIKHPNVAILYDYSHLPDGSFYMVSEYIEGEDVGQWIERFGPFPIQPALQLAIQALRGLEAIHTAGVVHRDISPDNMMITRNLKGRYQMKIIDLGLAKSLSPDPKHEITQAGMFMGKLQYCSPEQVGLVKGQVLDRRTDVYSFGMVLYEMITGMQPFASDDPQGFIFKRLSEDPLPLIGRNPAVKVPEALDQILRRALERDREKRIPDAIEFIQAIEPIEMALRQTTHTAHTLGGRALTDAPPRPASGISVARLVPSGVAVGGTRQASKSSISRAERAELLAEIDRAAERVRQTSKLKLENIQEEGSEVDQAARQVREMSKLSRLAEEALKAGHSQEAGQRIEALSQAYPNASNLPALRERLARASHKPEVPAQDLDAILDPTSPAPPEPSVTPAPRVSVETEEAAAEPEKRAEEPGPPAMAVGERKSQVREAEQILEGYLQKGRRSLADLALATLVELAPNHPRREEYESWVRFVGEEQDQKRRAQLAVEKGRAAIERGDIRAARKQLEIAARQDPSGQVAEAFLAELESAEQDFHETAEFEVHKERFEKALSKGRLEQAEHELADMAKLGLPKLTLSLYNNRLEEAQLEKAFDRLLEARDWAGARDIAHRLNESQPQSARPAAMFAHVDRQEHDFRRQTSIAQGTQQVEHFLETGNFDQAALALKILKQMDPDNPRWRSYERKILGQRQA